MKKIYTFIILLIPSLFAFSQNSLRLYYNSELLGNDDSIYFLWIVVNILHNMCNWL